jgi:starvation-inducible DNA-binding protein
MQPEIGLAQAVRESVGRILNVQLADEYALYVATRGAHWNVVGTDFSAMHAFFEKHYEELDEILDEVAERARALGMPAVASIGEYARLARGDAKTSATADSGTMVRTLLQGHESIIRRLRADLRTVAELGDDGTLDFLTGLMEQHEKMAWMLRVHLP